ncbi:MAG: hypothetical protein H6734_08010 [Alphaproteobacteria bacterium]|nr:hypothetical protein [Alphaproteobacteria bacterium]
MSKQGIRIGAPRHLWSPLEPEAVREVLENNARGTVTASSFSITLRPPRGGFGPANTLEGVYHRADGGTYLRVEQQVGLPLVAVLVVLTMFFGPLGGLIGAVVAWNGITEQKKRLDDWLLPYLDIQAEGHLAEARSREVDLADPMSEGAAAGAPPSFGVDVGFDAATFTLRGSAGTTTTLQVSQQGLRVKRAAHERTFAWVDLERIDVDDDRLMLHCGEDWLTVPMGNHSLEDRLWLGVFLQTRNERWSPSREAREADEARLRRMRGSRETD